MKTKNPKKIYKKDECSENKVSCVLLFIEKFTQILHICTGFLFLFLSLSLPLSLSPLYSIPIPTIYLIF